MATEIRFRLNGKPTTLPYNPERTLLRALRTDLGLTGTHYGCGIGECGSCTVVVDGKAVRSCVTTLADIQGKDVITIEGLAKGDQLHPLQRAFIEHGAFQCGYCTSGMLMNAYALTKEKKTLSRDEIIDGMEDNLCRCGAHQRIIAAIEEVAGAKGGRS